MTGARRGIGVNQGRILGLLVMMGPRPVEGAWLARAGDQHGDSTRGFRTLDTLATRHLVAPTGPTSRLKLRDEVRWVITNQGVDAFYNWFRVRVFGEEGASK